MRFVIDGDGCPVKNEVIQVGKQYDIPILIVTSVDHFTTKEYSENITFIYVDKGADGADYRIVKEIDNHDIVITQDYGLASLLLGKKVRIFHHNGKEYLPETIDTLLTQRYIGGQMRKAGKRTKGPKPFTHEDRQLFTRLLREVVEQEKNQSSHKNSH
ncbi:MAG: YaiI/YqxD family protein [Vagococcus sp.]